MLEAALHSWPSAVPASARSASSRDGGLGRVLGAARDEAGFGPPGSRGKSIRMASVMEQSWLPQLLLKGQGRVSWAMAKLTRWAVARVNSRREWHGEGT